MNQNGQERKQINKNLHYTILKHFTKQETVFEDCSTIVFQFKFKATHGKGRPLDLDTRIKILFPKQILQRLPMALVHVKAGNRSGYLLNEIRQITVTMLS